VNDGSVINPVFGFGAKGGALDELTAVSVAPAIADAIYHATGKRVRDLPIAVEKLL
jgi:xanthine dehydrogenase YagR molybdenum-binding subunit